MSARVAAVHVPDVALQVLLRDRPAWRKLPVVLARDDRPDAPVRCANEHARRLGVTEAMRLGAARGLAPTLRSAAVPDADVASSMAALGGVLRGLSPRVEPCGPGDFLVDPSGMGRLHRDVRAWAAAARRAVWQRGFACAVAVGFRRETALALARARRGVVVARTPHEERALAAEVPLGAVGLPTRALDALEALGLRTLGHLWSLPPDAVRQRFGDAAAEARAWCDDAPTVPVQPELPRAPESTVLEVDPPDDDLARLLFALRGALHLLVARLAARGEAVAAVELTLSLDDRTRRAHRLEPSTPTRDVGLLTELARLRLDGDALTAPVAEALVAVTAAPLRGEQLSLFAHDRARDPAAVARALARVRAAFGDASVTRARLREAHLPEARFAWEPVAAVPPPTPAEGAAPAMVRRLFVPPRELRVEAVRALSPVPRDEATLAWLDACAVNDGAGSARLDPWSLAPMSSVSGAWWARTVARDYYYAEASDGALLWVFHDLPRDRWFVQAVVD